MSDSDEEKLIIDTDSEGARSIKAEPVALGSNDTVINLDTYYDSEDEIMDISVDLEEMGVGPSRPLEPPHGLHWGDLGSMFETYDQLPKVEIFPLCVLSPFSNCFNLA